MNPVFKIAILSITLLSSNVFAQKNNLSLPLDSQVRAGKLSNGFTYFIRHNDEPKNRVIMYLVNKVGSILEDDDQRGLAHFMEHMSFNGTKHFPKSQLIDYLQRSGVRFGADLNAYTSFDETVYQLPLPTDRPGVVTNGLQIMRDWAQEASLESEEINRERGVVLEEKRLGKGAGERMRQLYYPVLLNHSRYANRIPIGLDTVLNNFVPSTIKRFYEDWYRPDLQALIIVGDINADSLEKIVRHQFADLKNPSHERMRTDYKVPLNGNNQFIAVTDPEQTTLQVQIIIKHPEHAFRTAQDYKFMIARELFNHMLSERFADLQRQDNPPFVKAGATISNFMGNLETFSVGVVGKPGELEKGIESAWREVSRLKKYGFTSGELERAKKAYLENVEDALKEEGKTTSANYVEEYQAYFLKGTAAPGIEKEYLLTTQFLPKISLQEINLITEHYITANNRDILILAPQKDKEILPSAFTVNGWLKSVEDESLKPYVDQTATATLLPEISLVGKIVSEYKEPTLGLITYTLSNGMKVVVKSTSFKNNEILFHGFSAGGSSLSDDTHFQSASNAAGIISSSGLGNYNPTQMSRFLEEKQVSVKPYISEREQGFTGGATPEDLETALQIIHGYFTASRCDSVIFNNIIARSKENILNRNNSPGNVFRDTVSAILSNYSQRRTGPTLEKLAQIKRDDVYKIFRERFADAANFTFTFVGNIDTLRFKPLIEKYLGSLPVTGKAAKATNLHIGIPAGQLQKTVYKGSEPKSTVLLVYSGTFDYNLENIVKLDALKEALQIRLIERLREDESGVYSPSAFVNTAKMPEARYALMVQFGCAPENVERLINDVKEEVERLKSIGPPQQNVDKWRAEDKNLMDTQLKTNSFWLSYLAGQIQNQEPANELSHYPALRDNVSSSAVKQMAEKYLGGDNFIRIVLMPENEKNLK